MKITIKDDDSVQVELDHSGSDGYISYQTIEGTVDNPLGDSGLSFSDLVNRIKMFTLTVGAYPAIFYDATAIGVGRGNGYITIDSDYIYASAAAISSEVNKSFAISWSESGLLGAYMQDSGVVTDISPYAQSIITNIFLPTKEEIT